LDKGLVSKICKEFVELDSKKTSNSITNWTTDLTRHLPKEDAQLVGEHSRCLTAYVIREMQIKTTRRATAHL